MVRPKGEVDREFASWFTGLVGADNLMQCIQCGGCSGRCPLGGFMDYGPRRLMLLAKEGYRDDVLGSNTIWLCTSCYSCVAECPRQIPVTDVMYALKREAIKAGTFATDIPSPVLNQEFGAMVRRHGRVTETWLLLRLYLRTGIHRILGMAKLGMRLLRTQRISVRHESVDEKNDMAHLLDAVARHKEMVA
jgi:heterodisulfide reductase subunit C/quinone-modifying oxidoreductase subunit QmoC